MSQSDAATTYLTQANAASTYETQANATASLALKASNADGTTIVDNGTNISTVAVKEQRASLAIKEWVGTKEQYDAIATKDSNTIYTITDEDDSAFLTVDSALSSTSENPVQNKVIYQALQNIDALPSQTGHSGEFLTTNGTTASWATVQTGGAPTLTWYKNNSGTTLDVSSLTGTISKVFKNGVLLEEGFTSYNLYMYSAPDTTVRRSLVINQQPDVSTAATWEFSSHMYYGGKSGIGCMFGPAGNDGAAGPTVLVWDSNNKFRCWLTDINGVNIFSGYDTISATSGHEYVFVFKNDGTNYTISIQDITEGTPITQYGSVPVASYGVAKIQDLISYFNVGYQSSYRSIGTIYLDKRTYFMVDNQYVYYGPNMNSTSVTNTSCNETTSTVATDPYNYNISSGTITFATPLLTSDKVAIETF